MVLTVHWWGLTLIGNFGEVWGVCLTVGLVWNLWKFGGLAMGGMRVVLQVWLLQDEEDWSQHPVRLKDLTK